MGLQIWQNYFPLLQLFYFYFILIFCCASLFTESLHISFSNQITSKLNKPWDGVGGGGGGMLVFFLAFYKHPMPVASINRFINWQAFKNSQIALKYILLFQKKVFISIHFYLFSVCLSLLAVSSSLLSSTVILSVF